MDRLRALVWALVALGVVLGVGVPVTVVWMRGKVAAAEQVAAQAASRAQEAELAAEVSRRQAQALRDSLEAATAARAAAERARRTAQTALSGVLAAAEAAAGDSAVTADSLRQVIRAVVAKAREDSVAARAYEARLLSDLLMAGRVIAADTVALEAAWAALRREQEAHRRTLEARACHVLGMRCPSRKVVGAVLFAAGVAAGR